METTLRGPARGPAASAGSDSDRDHGAEAAPPASTAPSPSREARQSDRQRRAFPPHCEDDTVSDPPDRPPRTGLVAAARQARPAAAEGDGGGSSPPLRRPLLGVRTQLCRLGNLESPQEGRAHALPPPTPHHRPRHQRQHGPSLCPAFVPGLPPNHPSGERRPPIHPTLGCRHPNKVVRRVAAHGLGPKAGGAARSWDGGMPRDRGCGLGATVRWLWARSLAWPGSLACSSAQAPKDPHWHSRLGGIQRNGGSPGRDHHAQPELCLACWRQRTASAAIRLLAEPESGGNRCGTRV